MLPLSTTDIQQRLVRFLASDGHIYYGDAILPPGTIDIAAARTARIITGDIFSAHTVTGRVVRISRLLSPLAQADLRSVRGLGLNYARHAREVGAKAPAAPIVFFKPVTAVSGPVDDIPVPLMAQESDSTDYECELVVVIGRETRDVPEHEALNYVFGYAVGNDVSHRDWQIRRGGGQWSLGKGFDGWGPFGPGIVSASIIKNPDNLAISTKLNGKVVQQSSTSDMIFSVAKTVSFLSRGTTLLPGDLIWMGT